MKKILPGTALTLCLFFAAIAAKAQAVSSEEIKTYMVKEWERAKAYTNEYLNTMPADKYGFKPVDSIRSFAQQMLHLAQANCGLMAVATGTQPPAFGDMFKVHLEQRPSAQTKDSVTYFVNASYDFCINAVKNSDVNKWGEKTKLFNFEVPRLGMMMKTFEHQTHHRGQTTIYIRLVGVKPPQEKLF